VRPPASKLVAGELSFAVAIAIEVGKLVRQACAIGVWFHDASAENKKVSRNRELGGGLVADETRHERHERN